MTQKREIEIKLRVANLGAMRAQLRTLGAKLGKRVHEYNFLFDTAEQRLRRTDKLLRLRLNEGAGLLTFKGRSLASPKGRAGRYKVRAEVEFAVADAVAAAAVLSQLGYHPTFQYEKYRTDIRVPGPGSVQVVLDETPIGAFLEVEGPPRAIDRVARKLGYRTADYETRSYLALYAEDCRRREAPMTDFLFASRKKRRKRSVSR